MYTDPNLQAILAESARGTVRTERYGHNGQNSRLLVGLTAVSIDAGEISSKINWGISGLDIGFSSDIQRHIDCFTVEHDLQEAVLGHYRYRNRSGHILAEARVAKSIGGGKFDVYVRGKERADVVKLFEQIRDGETAPESLGGRRGLIRSLRQQIAEISMEAYKVPGLVKANELLKEDVLFYRARIRELEKENAELKKPKLSSWQFFWRSLFGTNVPEVA